MCFDVCMKQRKASDFIKIMFNGKVIGCGSTEAAARINAMDNGYSVHDGKAEPMSQAAYFMTIA